LEINRYVCSIITNSIFHILDIKYIWIDIVGSFVVENLFQTKTSFGKYFDDQRDRIVKAMQNKNAQLWQEWREEFDKRQKLKKNKS
tara:strand:+ start:164 stop:421 length:258 start_codon:yes stop_codon:yes gene_type:complete